MDKDKKEILNLCSRYLDLDEDDHKYYEDQEYTDWRDYSHLENEGVK